MELVIILVNYVLIILNFTQLMDILFALSIIFIFIFSLLQLLQRKNFVSNISSFDTIKLFTINEIPIIYVIATSLMYSQFIEVAIEIYNNSNFLFVIICIFTLIISIIFNHDWVITTNYLGLSSLLLILMVFPNFSEVSYFLITGFILPVILVLIIHSHFAIFKPKERINGNGKSPKDLPIVLMITLLPLQGFLIMNFFDNLVPNMLVIGLFILFSITGLYIKESNNVDIFMKVVQGFVIHSWISFVITIIDPFYFSLLDEVFDRFNESFSVFGIESGSYFVIIVIPAIIGTVMELIIIWEQKTEKSLSEPTSKSVELYPEVK